MSTPQSKICICAGVRLNPSYEHTIYFGSLSEQNDYFSERVVRTFSEYYYLRKNWDINVQTTIEDAESWSYLYLTNVINGKRYYYFITNIEYVNESTVRLKLELDVMQTYMFDYDLLPCFVEREHASDDTIGANLVNEGLELGELFVNNSSKVDLSELCILIMSTFNLQTATKDNKDSFSGLPYNNIFSGLGFYAVDIDKWVDWGSKLAQFDSWGYSEGIVAMWLYPKTLIHLAAGENWSKVPADVLGVYSTGLSNSFARQSTLNGYPPKNNKLLTYPFNFMYVTNNTGGACVYHYEKFNDPSACKMKTVGALSPEGAVTIYPLNYNNVEHNYDCGLTLTGFPSCAWNNDVYKLWLAQNQNSQNMGLVSAGLTMAGGLVSIFSGAGTLVGAGAMVAGSTQIASHLAQKRDMEVQPPQARGNHSVSVNVINGFQTFEIQKKSVDNYHAKMIDEYFSMYGYKTNRVKTPNINVRKNWTYTKTVGCHIKSKLNRGLSTDDMLKIESIYNNGITFWVNGDEICNYTLNNSTL